MLNILEELMEVKVKMLCPLFDNHSLISSIGQVKIVKQMLGLCWQELCRKIPQELGIKTVTALC